MRKFYGKRAPVVFSNWLSAAESLARQGDRAELNMLSNGTVYFAKQTPDMRRTSKKLQVFIGLGVFALVALVMVQSFFSRHANAVAIPKVVASPSVQCVPNVNQQLSEFLNQHSEYSISGQISLGAIRQISLTGICDGVQNTLQLTVRANHDGWSVEEFSVL